MFQNLSLTLLIALVMSSCVSNAQQRPDNTKPMYGEVPKSMEHIEADEKFKKECLIQFGSLDSSVKVQIDHAWRYFYNNELQTAMKRFNQAWLLDPEYPDSYFGFGSLLDMQGNKEESEHYYKLGMEKDSSKTRSKICFQRIADCREALQDIEGTLKAYEQLAVVDPSNAFAFKKLGYFNMQTNNYVEAIGAYDKAIALDPKDAMTFNNRAYLYQNKKEYSSAISDYTQAIRLDPKYISAYVNRGITRMQIAEYIEAKKDFEACVQLDQNSGELRRMLGLAKLKLDDKKGACEDLEKARQYGDPEAEQILRQNCL